MTIAERVAASNAARVRMLDKWERETCPDWQEFAETLFGELEESHEANRSLTERLDRERALRMDAERERDLARERAHANMPLCVCAKWGGCHVNAGMAVVHFFDLARMQEIGACSALCVVGNLFGDERPEHETCRKFFDACTVRATAIETQRRLHSRTQAAESRAIRAERQVATLTARLDGAIREMTAERLRVWAEIESEYQAIPPVALEASDGGARMLDEAEKFVRHAWSCAGCYVIVPRATGCSACGADAGATPIVWREGKGWVEAPPGINRTIDGPSMRIGERIGETSASEATIKEMEMFAVHGSDEQRALEYALANAHAIRTALACQPGHELDAIAALVAAKDAYRAKFTEAECGWCKTKDHYLAARDSRIADLVTDRREARSERDEAIARAETAESALREIWSMVDGGTWPMYGSIETKGVVEVVRDRLAKGAR